MPDILASAIRIARLAGDELMRYFGRVEASPKSGLDLLTEADLASEHLILSELRVEFPDHTFIAEESSNSPPTGEWVWYIDPLDGTSNFSRCDPHFAVALGLVQRGKPYLGVVYNPAREQLFSAAPQLAGGEAFFNGRPIPTPSASPALSAASLGTDWPWDLGLRQHTAALLERAAPRVRQIKIRGCAALDLCDVALGILDAYLHPGCQAWDLAAPLAINAAVGTQLFSSDRLWGLSHQPIVACNPSLSQELEPLAALISKHPLHPLN